MMNLVAYFRKTNPPWNLVRAEPTFASASVKTMADKRAMAAERAKVARFRFLRKGHWKIVGM